MWFGEAAGGRGGSMAREGVEVSGQGRVTGSKGGGGGGWQRRERLLSADVTFRLICRHAVRFAGRVLEVKPDGDELRHYYQTVVVTSTDGGGGGGGAVAALFLIMR